jgi:membrane protease YdiL (CAAX protease family)
MANQKERNLKKMKHPLKQTNMLTEASSLGKGHSWGIEILIFLLVFFVAQMLQSIPIVFATVAWIFTNDAVMSALMQGNMAGYMEAATSLTTEMPDSLMLVQLFSTLLATIVAILFCRLIEKRRLSSMGLRRGNILSEYLVGSGFGIALISLCVGLCALFGGLKLSTSSFSVGVWLLYLVGFLIQGMSEEVMCRGYMMISVSRKNALWLAVMTNSVMFALLHIANPGFGLLPLINITLFGMLESVYVLKRGNLWGACAIHSLWNFFQGNVFGVSVSGTGTGASPFSATMTDGMEWLNGGTFGLEGGVVVTVVIALATLAAIFLMPTKQTEIAADPVAETDNPCAL